MIKESIDSKVYDLYDEYCHTQMTRRNFLNKASALVVASGSALVMAEALLPRYAEAQTISFTDERIKPISSCGTDKRIKRVAVSSSGRTIPGSVPSIWLKGSRSITSTQLPSGSCKHIRRSPRAPTGAGKGRSLLAAIIARTLSKFLA